ncbi:MAG: ABC transporter permease [Bacteroidetes bacterium]|nr:ABC transporter permease [Bacteroidota bacterium]
MPPGVLLKIARTHLLARKRQTAIASLGVTFGIGTFVILVSFMTGLNGLLDGLILNRTPHIRIYNEIKPSETQPIQNSEKYKNSLHVIHSIKPKQSKISIYNNQPLIAALKKDPRVKGITPVVGARVFYVSGAIQLNGNLFGVDVQEQTRLFNFGDYITKGKSENLANNENGIIIGAGVAKKLSLNLNDYVQVISTTGQKMRLKIVAFFQSGLADIDNMQSYVNIKTSQRIQGMPRDFITDIHVKLWDINHAVGMAAEIRNKFQLNAVDIIAANAQFETGTKIRNMITYAVSITLLIVAGFGIYNILNMLIFQKMNDIAILKATGFSGKDVRRIFLYQAMMIGIIGGIIGLIIGYTGSVAISKSPFETEALPTIHYFPVNFDPKFYVIGTVFAMLTTFFAGLMPARKASKVDPVEILRGQ